MGTTVLIELKHYPRLRTLNRISEGGHIARPDGKPSALELTEDSILACRLG